MAIFFEKIARIAQWLGAKPPGHYLSNLAVSNCSKNVQNVIQMAIFWKIAQQLGASAPGPHLRI